MDNLIICPYCGNDNDEDSYDMLQGYENPHLVECRKCFELFFVRTSFASSKAKKQDDGSYIPID